MGGRGGGRGRGASGGGGGAPGGKQRKSKPISVRIRNYQPALLAMALAGRAGDALALADEVAAVGREHLDFAGQWEGTMPLEGGSF